MSLQAMIREKPLQKSVMVDFLVVNIKLAYNAILRRRFLTEGKMVISLPHLKLKFPVKDKVGEVRGDQKSARECYLATTKSVHMIFDDELNGAEVMTGDRVEKPEMMEGDPKPRPVENLISIQIGATTEEITYIGSHLMPHDRARLIGILKENRDVFAFKADEVPGIRPKVMTNNPSI